MLENIEKRDRAAHLKEQLSDQNSLLQSVIQNMGDGLVVADKKRKVPYLTPPPKNNWIIGYS
jgi:signal transduction histidine kinase